MPGTPRLQYENVIYHVVPIGAGRRELFHNEGHSKRFTAELITPVDRCGWQVIADCWMPNHIHLKPCVGLRPTAESPDHYRYSSYVEGSASFSAARFAEQTVAGTSSCGADQGTPIPASRCG